MLNSALPTAIHLFISGWNPTADAIATYSRTFAQAVAGTPISMDFDAASLRFQLCYTVNPALREPTVIYVSSVRTISGELVDDRRTPQHMLLVYFLL